MTLRVALVTLLVGSGAFAIEPQPSQPAAGTQEGVIDRRANNELKRMSDYLSQLKSLRVDATTIDEKVTTSGQKIQELQESKILLRRPNGLRVDRVSPRGRAVFRYDGHQISLYNRDRQRFAVAPAPPRLNAAIDDTRARLHIEAPGGDLLVTDPYRVLTDGLITGRYIGLEPIDGTMAHHIAITKKDVDLQIWIKDGPEPVPLRYVITTNDLPSHPQFTIELRDWKPNAAVPAGSFAFTPPPGAKRIELPRPQKAER